MLGQWKAIQDMRIPKSVVIKGQEWTIEYKWNLRDDGALVDGLCVYSERKIIIRRELSKEEKPMVFLHEINHAILFESHVEPLLSRDVEEVICDSMAKVYLDLFKMRPI